MSRPVISRVLFGLASLLFVSGCSLGFIGLPPAVRRPALSALGMMPALASSRRG